MTIIGIAGPTGAGKTTLLEQVEELGGAVIDCDEVYHQLLKSDRPLQEALEKEFGPLRDAAGAIDRKKLGAIVFADQSKLERLNEIAQRATVQRTLELLEQHRAGGARLVAIDAFALLESGLAQLCSFTVAVLAKAEVRVQRIVAREGISEEYAWSRVRAQQPDEFFTRQCTYTIWNDCATAQEFGERARALLLQLIK